MVRRVARDSRIACGAAAQVAADQGQVARPRSPRRCRCPSRGPGRRWPGRRRRSPRRRPSRPPGPRRCSRRPPRPCRPAAPRRSRRVDADLGGDRPGGGRGVSGEQHGRSPSRAQLGIACGRGGFDRVGDDEQARRSAVPADRDRRSGRRSASARGSSASPARSLEQPRPAPTSDRVTVHDALRAQPWRCAKTPSPAGSDPLGRAPPATAAAIGCSEACSTRRPAAAASRRRPRRPGRRRPASSGRW